MSDKTTWQPNAKQARFLALPTSIKEGFYGGGAGSGKSDVLLVYPLAHKWHQNARFKQVFMRRTFPELRNEIVPRSRELYKHFGANFNRSEMLWTFPRMDQYGTGVGGSLNGGALIYLAHCEDENDVHKYDSMEINLFSPDELTSFTEYIYLYIGYTRVRTSDPTLPAIIRAAGMPGGIGHTFVKNRFIDPYKKAGIDPYNHDNKLIIGKGGNKRIYIHSTLSDNTHIDATYGNSLDALNDAERKAKKFGDWDAYLGLVFAEFRTRPYPDEPDNACHQVVPFTIPHYWPRFVIGDWGYRAMTYIMYCAVSPKGRLYIYREQHFKETKIEEWAPYVKYYIDKENPKIVKFCKSAGQDRGQDQTIQEQLSQALEVPIELSNNSPGSRVAGKILVHEYLRWKQKHINAKDMPVYSEEHAAWILRNQGLLQYKAYHRMFEPQQPEDNLPKLQIFCCDEDTHGEHVDCCPLVIEAIRSASYAKPKNNKPAEDVAEWDGDDPYDTLRYACDTAESYIDEAKQEFAKIQKMELIENQLAVTNDWTGFYRNARALDINNEQAIIPVSRFHKGSNMDTMSFLRSLGKVN